MAVCSGQDCTSPAAFRISRVTAFVHGPLPAESRTGGKLQSVASEDTNTPVTKRGILRKTTEEPLPLTDTATRGSAASADTASAIKRTPNQKASELVVDQADGFMLASDLCGCSCIMTTPDFFHRWWVPLYASLTQIWLRQLPRKGAASS